MKYHAQCLVSLYIRDLAESNTAQSTESSDISDTAKNTAFAELFSYIHEVLEGDETIPVFQLSELT